MSLSLVKVAHSSKVSSKVQTDIFGGFKDDATPSYKLISRYLSQSINQKAAEAIEVNIQ